MPLTLSPLYEGTPSRVTTQVFAGINRNLRCSDGEFFDMQNLTSDHVPVLAVRDRRYEPKWNASNPSDVVAGIGAIQNGPTKGVAWIEGKVLRLGEEEIDLEPYGFDVKTEKTIVRLGAYLVIVPDMIFVNTVKSEDRGNIEDRLSLKECDVFLAVMDYEGNKPEYAGKHAPEVPREGMIWLDTSSEEGIVFKKYQKKSEDVSGEQISDWEWKETDQTNGLLWLDASNPSSPQLKKYAKETNEWYQVESYLFIEFRNNGEIREVNMKTALRRGDAIRISGIREAESEKDKGRKVVQKVTEKLGEEETTVMNFSIFGIMTDRERTIEKVPVTIERVIPMLDFVCEAGNRLWGCKYGEDQYGNFVNEIYCSARGDMTRWIQGESTDDDSPVTFSIGVDGAWTGCINYNGYPTFFKQNSMHRVSGFGASGFSLQDTPCMGVQPGAARSLAVVNNALFYKTNHCIMAYDGSVPVNVSENLGRLSKYNSAVGGACGGKYYVSMWFTKADGSVNDPVLMVFDAEKGLWHKEDAEEVESMSSDGDNMFFVSVKRDGGKIERKIKAVRIPEYVNYEKVDSDEKESPRIQWYAETGVIGLETPDFKYVSRLSIRLHLDAGASVRILVQYDSRDYWKQIVGTETNNMKTVSIPVVPVRCDHMRLRLEGVGGCKIYSITKTIESGEEA